MNEEIPNLHQQWLMALLAEYEGTDLAYHTHLLRGSPRKLIPKLARSESIELIVMGTSCRTGVSGLLIGNTGVSILRQVNCSMLAVKPETFVTPDRLEDG